MEKGLYVGRGTTNPDADEGPPGFVICMTDEFPFWLSILFEGNRPEANNIGKIDQISMPPCLLEAVLDAVEDMCDGDDALTEWFESLTIKRRAG